MIIVLTQTATRDDADELLQRIADAGLRPLYLPGTERTMLGAIGDKRGLAALNLESDPRVESVRPILASYTMVSRELRGDDTVIDIDGVKVGGKHFLVIAGPCSVESLEQMQTTAEAVKAAGARALRGAAFKPRASPYGFHGLGAEGLAILRDVARATGMPTFTEVADVADVEAIEAHVSAFQIGARNMQNYRLLQCVGQSRKPVLLKRGMAASIDNLLNAAEYILSEGNPNVILCEHGIKTFETSTRSTLDLNAIPVIKARSHLPVIVDPSHGTGVREYVAPMALAAAACGADGIIVEVHQDPAVALTDGTQSLYPAQFQALMTRLQPVVAAMGRIL